MKDSVKILLVGVGGYGANYLNSLLDKNDPKYRIEGIVEPYPERSERIGEAIDKGVPLYNSMTDFYAEHTADLAVISTPIHLHTPMILEALANNSNVVCEKPLCGDDKDIEKLIEARDKAGKFVFIGYQWSHSEAVLELKKDIIAGVLGKPILLKAMRFSPTNHAYYQRGIGWAGRLTSKNGAVIRDSIANNAGAHNLHNMFFILGDTIDTAKMPKTIESKVYRANDIESFDTAEIYCTNEDGSKVIYLASHAANIKRAPESEYRFEKGTVYFSDVNGDGKPEFYADLNDGTRKIYGNPSSGDLRKLYIAADNILNGTNTVYCGIEAASVHTRVIAAIHEQHPVIEKFPDEMLEVIVEKDQPRTVCKGLAEKYIEIYESL